MSKYVLGQHNMTVVLQASGFSSLSLQYRLQNSPLAIFFSTNFLLFYGYWSTDYSLPVTRCPLWGLFLQCLCCTYYYHYIKMIIVLLLLNYFCCCCCNIQGMTKVLTSHDLSGWNAFITLKFWLLPFEVTKEVKLSMFQHKIIHNILCTKSLLFKMKKEDSPRCPFCPADHTIIHLFTECAQATLFWKEFLD